MSAPSYQDRLVYHITHVRNLPGIFQEKALLCDTWAGSQKLTVTDIGMPSIKSRRRTTKVTCEPGGTPADYVPFYFGPRSPMLYSISTGNVPTYQEGQKGIIYLVSSLVPIRRVCQHRVFTEGNAGAGFVEFHQDDESLLESLIDWPLMNERYWADTAEDPRRANRRQAEYLVHGSLPVSALHFLAARDRSTTEKVNEIQNLFGNTLPVQVRPEWYY